MYKQVKVRKSKVKVFVLPTAVSISSMIWNLGIDLIILQTQKRKIVNEQRKKRKKRKKGKKKKEKKTII